MTPSVGEMFFATTFAPGDDGPGDDGAIRLLAYRDGYELTWWLRPDNHARGCLDDSLDLVYCADSVFVLRVG